MDFPINVQKAAGVLVGLTSLLTVAGSAILWAADDRYVLRDEAKKLVRENQDLEKRDEIEWLLTLQQVKPLTTEQQFRLQYLQRRIVR